MQAGTRQKYKKMRAGSKQAGDKVEPPGQGRRSWLTCPTGRLPRSPKRYKKRVHGAITRKAESSHRARAGAAGSPAPPAKIKAGGLLSRSPKKYVPGAITGETGSSHRARAGAAGSPAPRVEPKARGGMQARTRQKYKKTRAGSKHTGDKVKPPGQGRRSRLTCLTGRDQSRGLAISLPKKHVQGASTRETGSSHRARAGAAGSPAPPAEIKAGGMLSRSPKKHVPGASTRETGSSHRARAGAAGSPASQHCRASFRLPNQKNKGGK